jgi:hypothetical protein
MFRRARVPFLAVATLVAFAACSNPTGPQPPADAAAASLLRIGVYGNKGGISGTLRYSQPAAQSGAAGGYGGPAARAGDILNGSRGAIRAEGSQCGCDPLKT